MSDRDPLAGKGDAGGFGIAFELDEGPGAPAPASPGLQKLPPPKPPPPRGEARPPGPPPPAQPQGKPARSEKGPAAPAEKSPFARPKAGQTPKEAAEATGLPNHYGGDRIDLGISPGPEPDETATPINLRDAALDAAKVAAEKGKIVADMTREAAVAVAGRTRSAAINAAVMSIGGAEPEKVIRLEDPSTWIKPMRGPLLLLAGAVLLSIIGVIVGRVTGAPLPIGWISGLLVLGAVGFGVVRWIRLQQD